MQERESIIAQVMTDSKIMGKQCLTCSRICKNVFVELNPDFSSILKNSVIQNK